MTTIFGLGLFTSCSKADKEESVASEPKVVTTGVNAAEAATLLSGRNDVTVLDVRTPKEFSGGHIKGALNFDIKQDDFKEKLAKLEKGKAFLVHCRSGHRSQRSVVIMEALGFENIYHLDGGLNAWQLAGNPVAMGDGKE